MTDSESEADTPFTELGRIAKRIADGLLAAFEGIREGAGQLSTCMLDLADRLRDAGLIPDRRRTTKPERRAAKRDLALRRRTGSAGRPKAGIAAWARERRRTAFQALPGSEGAPA